MTTFGVSYWGIDPIRASRDAQRIAESGFSWVNMPISEEQMAYNHTGRVAIVSIFQATGLEVRVSPWGVGGAFGGEGIRGWGNDYQTAEEWLRRAERLAPDAIYWDEPKGVRGATIIEGLRPSLPEHIYLNPRVGIAPADDTLARMASIGIDCYDRTFQEVEDEARGLVCQYSKPIHVWVRAFRIDRDHTLLPAGQVEALRNRGLDIAIWGYPSPGVSCLNNDRPRKVWRAITDAMGNPS